MDRAMRASKEAVRRISKETPEITHIPLTKLRSESEETVQEVPATATALAQGLSHALDADSSAAEKSVDPNKVEVIVATSSTKQTSNIKEDTLVFTRKFAGGLRADLKRRAPWYWSDWVFGRDPNPRAYSTPTALSPPRPEIDAFKSDSRSQALASTIFLFFACLSPAVTFGMLFDEYTEGHLGVVEMILSSSVSGIGYAMFSGQPICIMGATGPELAYTAVFYNICKQLDLEFLPARLWQGLWCALITILLAIFDLSALMRHVTRFTEEIFSALISCIFIVEAFISVITLYVDDSSILGRARAYLGTLLCFGTYVLATWCKGLKSPNVTLFTPFLRKNLANYGVIISILVFSAINYGFRDVGSAMLQVPEDVAPTFIDNVTKTPRAWLVNPMGIHKPFPVWGIFFALGPALGLAVLGYLDQNLTSILINRDAHGLKKPPGYHLDMFVCGVFIYPICSFMGLPFTHAATVRSMTHLASLTTREVIPLEGGGSQSKVTKVIESRTTGLLIHVILLCSLYIAPVLRLVPRACLFGVFLFMGVGSMAGCELFDRMFLWGIWDMKRYPQYEYVKNVSFKALHGYTLLQVCLLGLIYGLTRLDDVSVAFPFLIGALVFVRWGLKWCFSEESLKYLDS